jgi:PhzF family phenazine biosynthesis protein
MNIHVKIINAFGINGTGGNPAGVVLNADALTAATKQSVAAQLGLSETVFVSQSATAGFKLEFFTPTRQIAHCGHATIAAFAYLKQSGVIKEDQSSKETIDGNRDIYFTGTGAYMEQQAPAFRPVSGNMHLLRQSLHLPQAGFIANMQPAIVNTGNSFLIIPVENETALQNIRPDFEMIKQVSEQYSLVGYYLFAKPTEATGTDATCRMFAPLYGIEEEAATGMAAGPLACYLHEQGIKKDYFLIEQGRFMTPPSVSRLNVNLVIEQGKIKKLFAGGSAYTAREIVVTV